MTWKNLRQQIGYMGSHDLANGSVTPATILSYEAS